MLIIGRFLSKKVLHTYYIQFFSHRANLSGDYFTSRQDRYMIIQDHKPLSDFFDDLSRVLCKISFQLTPDGKFILDKEFPLSPVSVTQRGEYLKRSRSLVLDMYDGYRTRNTTAVSPGMF
jgi:hypothetical protein